MKYGEARAGDAWWFMLGGVLVEDDILVFVENDASSALDGGGELCVERKFYVWYNCTKSLKIVLKHKNTH